MHLMSNWSYVCSCNTSGPLIVHHVSERAQVVTSQTFGVHVHVQRSTFNCHESLLEPHNAAHLWR